jgi:26S proteasome regulatory subunit N1
MVKKKNKERGQMASVASIGLLMLWDQNAVNTVDRYFESEHNYIRAGAYLAIGLACSGMRNEAGVGHALLAEPSLDEKKTLNERIAATLGLGLAYAGQENKDVYSVLANLVGTNVQPELSSVATLSLGLLFVGSCNQEVSEIILDDLLQRIEKPEVFDDSMYLMNALGLGLIFLQRCEDVETTLDAVEVFGEVNKKYCDTLKTTLEVLAYAGSGNVLKVQKLLSIFGEHFDTPNKNKDENKYENKE